MNWRQVLLGPLAFMIFLFLFVFMMNKISAPNARFELGDFVIIADLIIALTLLMVMWGPLVNGEPFEQSMPLAVPSWVGIPVGVCLFVFLYVSGLGEILLHLNEVQSPAFAITFAMLILFGAWYLDWRSPHPAPDSQDGGAHGHEEHH
ncbi:MAG TPA: hypothetical protein VFE42_14020 [Chloroflexota bacterium]|nr:hypothetical protein [Chloroflexota bacterium]